MNVIHLTDSPFYGGPERQMLGLATSLPPSVRTTILCFRDNGSSAPFLAQLARADVPARTIGHANPHFLAMVGDVMDELRRERADLLVCHGYKADVIGWLAARRAGVPVMSVSRGWTGHTRKVRLNEAIDRRMLRRMDRVVCVSEGQAVKVRRAGVPAERVRVIRNSIDVSRFRGGASKGRSALLELFASPPELVAVGVGRLSPEKGFAQFIDAARLVLQEVASVGFVLVGDGPERAALAERIREAGLESRVLLTGFRSDVDQLLAGADLLVQSSFTEGLPNVVLEACAAGVAVVATDVGGTGEVIRDGVNGHLVPPGEPRVLAARILDLLRSAATRRAMGSRGRELVQREFSFVRQSAEYQELFESLLGGGARRAMLASA